MIPDIIVTLILFSYSIWSFIRGIRFVRRDKGYSSWSVRFHYFTTAIGTLFIALLILTGKVHVLDFFD